VRKEVIEMGNVIAGRGAKTRYVKPCEHERRFAPIKSDPPVLLLYVDQAARESGYSVAELLGPVKSHRMSRVRWWYWAEARKHGHSVSSIARAWNRDHTTIMHAFRKMGVEW